MKYAAVLEENGGIKKRITLPARIDIYKAGNNPDIFYVLYQGPQGGEIRFDKVSLFQKVSGRISGYGHFRQSHHVALEGLGNFNQGVHPAYVFIKASDSRIMFVQGRSSFLSFRGS